MHFLNFLPLVAALVAAAPAAEPPTKDLARRNAQPCGTGGNGASGCYDPPDTPVVPDFTKDDVVGVVVYDVQFEGTLDYYEVSFSSYNPNTKVYTPCRAGVKNTKDFQRCERMRTAFIVNTDENQIVTHETITVYVKIIWQYTEAALPRAVLEKKGHHVNEAALKGIYYYQVGELTFQAKCTVDTKTSTIDGGGDGTTIADDDMICNAAGYCHAPYADPPSNDIVKKETRVHCDFKGELTVVTIVLKKGEWDGMKDGG